MKNLFPVVTRNTIYRLHLLWFKIQLFVLPYSMLLQSQFPHLKCWLCSTRHFIVFLWNTMVFHNSIVLCKANSVPWKILKNPINGYMLITCDMHMVLEFIGRDWEKRLKGYSGSVNGVLSAWSHEWNSLLRDNGWYGQEAKFKVMWRGRRCTEIYFIFFGECMSFFCE